MVEYFCYCQETILRKKELWNRCGDNDQIANRDSKLKFISIRKVKRQKRKR